MKTSNLVLKVKIHWQLAKNWSSSFETSWLIFQFGDEFLFSLQVFELEVSMQYLMP
jgi:hypothetical protein